MAMIARDIRCLSLMTMLIEKQLRAVNGGLDAFQRSVEA